MSIFVLRVHRQPGGDGIWSSVDWTVHGPFDHEPQLAAHMTAEAAAIPEGKSGTFILLNGALSTIPGTKKPDGQRESA